MADSELTLAEIVEHIFCASSLETAILWREEMLGRLQADIETAARTGALNRHRVQRLLDARRALSDALGHLRLALLNNERIRWQDGSWEAINVWSPPPTK